VVQPIFPSALVDGGLADATAHPAVHSRRLWIFFPPCWASVEDAKVETEGSGVAMACCGQKQECRGFLACRGDFRTAEREVSNAFTPPASPRVSALSAQMVRC
jgi:hypothetical protein